MSNKILKIALAFSVAGTGIGPVAAPVYGHSTYSYHTHRYKGRTHYARKYCRRSAGTTGLVAGGVTGAVVGSKVIGGGILGVAAGAVGGAVAGRAIDRSVTERRRCYWR
ncbi:MAG: hypothetical protein ABI454_07445 [Sphingomicrobium sp.]